MKHGTFWIALVALMVLHHDWWFWNDGRLLFGFLPVGLAYHASISLAAVGLWTWAAFYALADRLAEEGDEEIKAASNASTEKVKNHRPEPPKYLHPHLAVGGK